MLARFITAQRSNSTEAGKGYNKLLLEVGQESSHMLLKLQGLIQNILIFEKTDFYFFTILKKTD